IGKKLAKFVHPSFTGDERSADMTMKGEEPMSLIDRARDELRRAGFLGGEAGKYERAIAENVLAMFEVFVEDGHSGASASLAISLFESLARFEPLTPLTGEDDEWIEHDLGNGKRMWQNRR